MTSNIQLGESSDGQFIYLTGLLPKKQGVTIIDHFSNTYNAIPLLLKKQDSSLISLMTIPTASTMWRQDAMCKKYSIEYLHSRKDYINQHYEEKWLDDKTLFEYTANNDKTLEQPFISIILTSSTHTPYIKEYECNNIKFPDNYPESLRVYLSNIHYMDKYLGQYLNSLKAKGLYNNSLIIITSDHPISKDWLNAKDMAIPSTIPLYIVNSPVHIDKGPDYPINQIDVFPTILDLAGVKSSWRGVGNSLLTPDSILQSKTEIFRQQKRQQISDIILDSDYFSLKTNK